MKTRAQLEAAATKLRERIAHAEDHARVLRQRLYTVERALGLVPPVVRDEDRRCP